MNRRPLRRKAKRPRARHPRAAAELATKWVAFAQHKPRLVLAEVLEHHPVGDAAYVTLVHDYHDGLPDAVAAGGQAHYRSLLTWVLDQDGWRLRDKVWVDAPR